MKLLNILLLSSIVGLVAVHAGSFIMSTDSTDDLESVFRHSPNSFISAQLYGDRNSGKDTGKQATTSSSAKSSSSSNSTSSSSSNSTKSNATNATSSSSSSSTNGTKANSSSGSSSSSSSSSNSTNGTKANSSSSSSSVKANSSSNSSNATNSSNSTSNSTSGKSTASKLATNGSAFVLTGKGNQLSTTIYAGTPIQAITVGFDSRFSTFILATNSSSSNYNPLNSTTDSVSDPFRQKDGYNNTVVGHYYNDKVCFSTSAVYLKANLKATTSSSSKTTTSSSSKASSSSSSSNTSSSNTTLPTLATCVSNQLIFGAELVTSTVPYSGVIGLGLTQATGSKSFLSNFGNVWSYYASPYSLVNSVVVIGAANKAYMKANKTFLGYAITSNSSYTVSLDGFGVSNYTYVNYTIARSTNNTNEAQSALLSPESDSIIVTNKTFANIVTYFQSAGFTCNNTATVSQCYYSGICSDIVSKLSSFYFSFGGDAVKYMVPPQSYLVEDSTALVCRAKFSKTTTGSTITLGQPWFRTFYTGFDIDNSQISFVPGVDSFGSTM